MYKNIMISTEGVLVRVSDVHIVDIIKVTKWLEKRGYKRNANMSGYVKMIAKDDLADEETILKNYDEFRGAIEVFSTGHADFHHMRVNGKSKKEVL